MVLLFEKNLYNTDDMELISEIEYDYDSMLTDYKYHTKTRFYKKNNGKPILSIKENGRYYKNFVFRLNPFKIGFVENYQFTSTMIEEREYQFMILGLLQNNQYDLAEKLAEKYFKFFTIDYYFIEMLKDFEKIGKKDLVNRLFKTYQEDK